MSYHDQRIRDTNARLIAAAAAKKSRKPNKEQCNSGGNLVSRTAFGPAGSIIEDHHKLVEKERRKREKARKKRRKAGLKFTFKDYIRNLPRTTFYELYSNGVPELKTLLDTHVTDHLGLPDKLYYAAKGAVIKHVYIPWCGILSDPESGYFDIAQAVNSAIVGPFVLGTLDGFVQGVHDSGIQDFDLWQAYIDSLNYKGKIWDVKFRKADEALNQLRQGVNPMDFYAVVITRHRKIPYAIGRIIGKHSTARDLRRYGVPEPTNVVVDSQVSNFDPILI